MLNTILKLQLRSNDNEAILYGTEYQAGSGQALSALNQDNAPCVVCEVTTRSKQIMIPEGTPALTCASGVFLPPTGADIGLILGQLALSGGGIYI